MDIIAELCNIKFLLGNTQNSDINLRTNYEYYGTNHNGNQGQHFFKAI